MKFTIIYSRVSTDKQTCDSQLGELRDWCKRKYEPVKAIGGWTNIHEITDTISGSKFTRTGLDELMRLVRANKVESVLCFRLDRLGRSLPHLAQLIQEFTAHGVALIVPSQNIDTSNANPASTLQMHVLIAVAQFEREIIRERVLAGLKAAKARGVRLGRKPLDDLIRREICVTLQFGNGVRETARILNLPVSTVHRVKASMAA